MYKIKKGKNDMWFDDYDLTVTCEEYYSETDRTWILPEDYEDIDNP